MTTRCTPRRRLRTPTESFATLQVVPGKPVDVILDAARRIEPELIVVGSDSAPATRLHHGVGEAVSRRAPYDVLVVRKGS